MILYIPAAELLLVQAAHDAQACVSLRAGQSIAEPDQAEAAAEAAGQQLLQEEDAAAEQRKQQTAKKAAKKTCQKQRKQVQPLCACSSGFDLRVARCLSCHSELQGLDARPA